MSLLLALAATSAVVFPPCPAPRAVPVAQSARPRSAMHYLGDEPPADAIAAVDRQINHCPAPIVLRRGVGMPEKSER